jgi:uncharacterized membrane protein
VRKSADQIAFILIIIAAGLFVLRSGGTLPAMVGAHFNQSGAANGYLSRDFYVRFMLIFVMVLPVALNLLVNRVLRLPATRLNIPHREYWLAPERRAQTVERLQRHMRFFGVLLSAFLCYVHWQVVRANAHTPPLLDNVRFSTGLATFMAALVAWIVVLRRNFRPPQQ